MLVCLAPACSVRGEVVPASAEVESEDVPAYFLAAIAFDDRCVADESPPVRHIDSGLPADDSVAVCAIVPACVQLTVPPGPTGTVAGSNLGLPGESRILPVAVAGPTGSTTTFPLMGCIRHMQSTVPKIGNE